MATIENSRFKIRNSGLPVDGLPAKAQERLRNRAQPAWVRPMLATLTARRFSDPEWIFEPKLDGVRCLAFRREGRVRLLSRNRLPLNDTYPEIVEALEAKASEDCILDGEIVAFRGRVSSFAELQGRIGLKDPAEARASGIRVYYYVFDLMHLGGHDTTRLELRHRKRLLRKALAFGGAVRFATHRNAAGEAFYAEACRKGWEGILAKRADSPYVGGRSDDWLKMKCENEQELVIGGYTDPKGQRVGLGALLLGYYEGSELRYAGKVGTGFDTRLLLDLQKRLSKIERAGSPFDAQSRKLLPRGDDVHWAEPRLVAQIAFTEWTEDGKLRHPRFLGLREDKQAVEVVRERPEA